MTREEEEEYGRAIDREMEIDLKSWRGMLRIIETKALAGKPLNEFDQKLWDERATWPAGWR